MLITLNLIDDVICDWHLTAIQYIYSTYNYLCIE